MFSLKYYILVTHDQVRAWALDQKQPFVVAAKPISKSCNLLFYSNRLMQCSITKSSIICNFLVVKLLEMLHFLYYILALESVVNQFNY